MPSKRKAPASRASFWIYLAAAVVWSLLLYRRAAGEGWGENWLTAFTALIWWAAAAIQFFRWRRSK